jgi:hypothetical protein
VSCSPTKFGGLFFEASNISISSGVFHMAGARGEGRKIPGDQKYLNNNSNDYMPNMNKNLL